MTSAGPEGVGAGLVMAMRTAKCLVLGMAFVATQCAAQTVGGIVLESSGAPAGGAVVLAHEPAGELDSRAEVDASGRFLISLEKIQGPRVALHALGADGSASEVRFASAGSFENQLVLRPARAIRGRIAPGAQDVREVIVISRSVGYGADRRFEAAVDPEGTFRVVGVDPRARVLAIGARGRAFEAVELADVVRSGDDDTDLDIGVVELQPGKDLAGRVVSRDTGEGISGAVVGWSPLAEDDWRMTTVARSGEDGAFSLDGVPVDDVTLVVSAHGFVGWTDRVAAAESSIEVALDEAASVAGTLFSADGAPLRSTLRLSDPGGLGTVFVETQPDGDFSVEGLPAGSYELFAGGSDFSPALSFTVAPGEALTGIAVFAPSGGNE